MALTRWTPIKLTMYHLRLSHMATYLMYILHIYNLTEGLGQAETGPRGLLTRGH